MTQAFAATGQNAKNGVGGNGYEISETDTFSWIHGAITNFFVSLKPQKTWSLIADVLGLKEHAAKHRAANHRDYSIEELMVLLHSENGDEILTMLMDEAEPAWWRALKVNLNLSKALAAQAQWQQTVMSLDAAPLDQSSRKKIKRVMNADRAFSRARDEKTTAVGILHQNRDRTVAGPVAAAAVKGKIQAAGMQRAGGRR